MSDLVEPTSGTVAIRGGPAIAARRANRFGFVFQDPALLSWRTAIGNVQLPLEVVGYPVEQRRMRCEALLNSVGLLEFKDAYPHELSGGMKQRVAIVRALAWNASILLMDEPFSALDELTKNQLQDDLLRIQTHGAENDFVRHPQYLRSRLSRRSGRGNVAASRPHRRDPAGRPAAPPDRGVARAAGVSEPGAGRTRGVAQMSSAAQWPRFRRWLDQVVPPAIILVVLLVVWQGAVRILDLPPWLLPAPSDIAARFGRTNSLGYHTGMTVIEALSGFVIAAVFGISLSGGIVHSRFLKRGLLPYIIVSNAIPIIAIMPLLTIWFGFGMVPKIAICAIISFFPIVTNTTRGLRSADYRVIEFMRSINATPVQVFLKVQLPSALPFIFAGFKIAGSLALVGAVVSGLLQLRPGTRLSHHYLGDRAAY